MTKLLLLIVPVFIYANGLKELIDDAFKQNDLIVSKEFTKKARAKNLSAKKSSYFPTIDLGAFYKRDDSPTPLRPRDMYSGFAKFGVDIYDGGKKSAEIKSAKKELESSSFDKKAMKKDIALSISKDFFTIKSLQAELRARLEAQKALKAQLNRIEQFFKVKLATKDSVDRLKSAYDTNIYDMQSIKFQILSLKKSLELKVGEKIDTLDNSSFKKMDSTDYEILDSIKSAIAKKSSIKENSKIIESIYYPNIRLEDKYSLYAYDKEDPIAKLFDANPLSNQNTLLLTLNFRLFDYGELRKQKEAVLLDAQALNAQILYKNKEQKIEYDLAKSRIETTKLKILSAKSSLIAAKSAYASVEEKYKNGIVDYVVYLDALSKKTSAKATYESSLNDLEIAYAIYYYYSGKNIEEFIK